MFHIRYLLSLLPAVLAIAGNLWGSYYTLGNILFSMMLMVFLEWMMPEDTDDIPYTSSGAIPGTILLLAAVFHTAGVFSLLYGIHTGTISSYFIGAAAASTGLAGGILGITSAHEMVHCERQPFWQLLGIWNLFIVNYAHFFTEHRLVHHVKVGTSEDPATARFGESIYTFWLRTIPSQWYNALHTDARRQQRKGRQAYGLFNFTLRSSVLQLLFTACIAFTLGWVALLAYLWQSITAILLLEYVNYIEHYGLARQTGERVGKQHAWQADTISSRFTLFELSRHTDHHLRAAKPYYELQSFAASPKLPFGYFGMFYLTLIPPLFFRKMHPRIAKAAADAAGHPERKEGRV